jgi:hypothetical protein
MKIEPLRASLKFLADRDEPLVYIPSKGGGDETDHVGNFTMREVSIHDGRHEKPSSSLDVEGFKLVSQKTGVDDFYDDAQIESTYHDEVEALLMEMTGAARIEVFDDTRRSASLQRQRDKGIREPADIVHNDYTARSGVKRLRDHFADSPDAAEELLERRFAIVNVWRSIAGPVYNHPLVLSTTPGNDGTTFPRCRWMRHCCSRPLIRQPMGVPGLLFTRLSEILVLPTMRHPERA